jgi:hypothetical protein
LVTGEGAAAFCAGGEGVAVSVDFSRSAAWAGSAFSPAAIVGHELATYVKVTNGMPIASNKKVRDKIERSARVRLRRIFEIRCDLGAGILVFRGRALGV